MDKASIDIFHDIKNKSIDNCLAMIEDIDKKIQAYEDLYTNMLDLRSKSHVEAMVPINEIAYFKGKLKHQNEILAFIGDNYFVERTVDECKPIIDRRIELLKKDK